MGRKVGRIEKKRCQKYFFIFRVENLEILPNIPPKGKQLEVGRKGNK